MTEQTRAGIVSLMGAPNAGKSTLTNALVGGKVTIVSRKVQTTRSIVRGITLHENTQIVLLDTPGLFQPKRKLDKAMVTAAWSGTEGVDIIAYLIDVSKKDFSEDDPYLKKLNDLPAKKILLLNKIDLISRDKLLQFAEQFNQQTKFDQTFMISAHNGSGLQDLLKYLSNNLPQGPYLYPPEDMSEAPLRFLAAEITREQIYDLLHDEIPYQTHVETENWTTTKKGEARIEQVIYVQRESQRKILLGRKGETIKKISTRSREEITKLIDTKAHLFLFVKVRENWAQDPERFRAMGLDIPI